MSGFFAPDRIERPRPDRATNRRDSNCSLPALISASMSAVVIIARSNGSPASIRFLICVDGSYEITPLLPVVRSNCGNSSSTTAFTPFVQKTLISAARADVARAKATKQATVRITVFIKNLSVLCVLSGGDVSVFPDELEDRPIEHLGLFPVR